MKFKYKKGITPIEDTIVINKKEYKIKRGSVYHSDLYFWDQNPRTYTTLSEEVKSSQHEIYEHLKSLDNVRTLRDDIVSNGGLTDPLIVRGDNGVVIEGNRRLAALRMIFENHQVEKWALAKVDIFPIETPEDAYFALIGNYHIKGKRQWTPFEQAGYIYRNSQIEGVTTATLAIRLAITEARCKSLIETYKYMQDNNFKDPIQWSYFDEYLKSNHIAKVRKTNTSVDKLFNKQVRNGKIEKAIDVRKKLAPLFNKAPQKLINKYIKGQVSLDEAHEMNQAGGNLDELYIKIKKFRTFINESSNRDSIITAEPGLKKKLTFELRKIYKYCNNLID